MLGFCLRFANVPGERMLAKIRWSSSQTAVVPFGEIFGVLWAHRGEEAEALFFDDALHVGSEKFHGCSPSPSLAIFYGSKRKSEMANPMREKSDPLYFNLSSDGTGSPPRPRQCLRTAGRESL